MRLYIRSGNDWGKRLIQMREATIRVYLAGRLGALSEWKS